MIKILTVIHTMPNVKSYRTLSFERILPYLRSKTDVHITWLVYQPERLKIEPIISYWVTREVARGLESAKTAIFSSGVFSSMGVIIYLIIVHFVHSGTDTNFESIFFAAFLIPITPISKKYTKINAIGI